ncbi:Molybdate transporter-like protein [Heracleum sosnowskyi]|uniref:Molybdate transporter-like protein n=1 Tax=Heracleum sosnowskyi TaxID=360622 RepID=A0AAD8H0I4_9APIA|nr:Molybdate transporter-like protein [Heracleum sosnowskyi]
MVQRWSTEDRGGAQSTGGRRWRWTEDDGGGGELTEEDEGGQRWRIIPLPVVRGVQLAQGLSFAMTAVKYVRKEQNFAKSTSGGDRPWIGLDGIILALVCAFFIIVVTGAGDLHEEIENLDDMSGIERFEKKRKLRKIIASFPSAFVIFLVGVIFGFIRGPQVVKDIAFGPSSFGVVKISKQAWRVGFIKGTIPQLPLICQF